MISEHLSVTNEQRQIQDFPKGGGVGCRGYGYFILGLSVVGHITRCTDKMSMDKILGDQTPVKIPIINNGITAEKMEGNILESKFICHNVSSTFYFKITYSFIVFL